jgi:hypothetical protein
LIKNALALRQVFRLEGLKRFQQSTRFVSIVSGLLKLTHKLCLAAEALFADCDLPFSELKLSQEAAAVSLITAPVVIPITSWLQQPVVSLFGRAPRQ